jgi:hypothetical protein
MPSKVLRMPPWGKLEPSGSPWVRVLPVNWASELPCASGSREGVVLLRRQTGQWVEDVGVTRRAVLQRQARMAEATESAIDGSSGAPLSIVVSMPRRNPDG